MSGSQKGSSVYPSAIQVASEFSDQVLAPMIELSLNDLLLRRMQPS